MEWEVLDLLDKEDKSAFLTFDGIEPFIIKYNQQHIMCIEQDKLENS